MVVKKLFLQEGNYLSSVLKKKREKKWSIYEDEGEGMEMWLSVQCPFQAGGAACAKALGNKVPSWPISEAVGSPAELEWMWEECQETRGEVNRGSLKL